jgi:hypothetical protein
MIYIAYACGPTKKSFEQDKLGLRFVKEFLWHILYIVSCLGCDYRRGLDWWMDLLTTYSANANLHNSQITTAPAKRFSSLLPSPAIPRQRLLTLEILQLPALRSSLLWLAYRTACQLSSLESGSESELLYDWRFTASQFVFATSPLRLTTSNSFFCWTLALIVPLWREGGSVVYNCCWPSPEQSFSGPSPAGLMTTF